MRSKFAASTTAERRFFALRDVLTVADSGLPG